MDELIDTVRREVPRVFESEDYAKRVEVVLQGLQTRRQELTAGLEKTAMEAGFSLRFVPTGITSLPLKNGRPLSDEERESMKERAAQLQLAINRTLADIRCLEKTAQEETLRVDRESFTLTPIIDELQAKYAHYPEVVTYLD